VLSTLTPREYSQFRGTLGSSSGFQSYQYRAVEFILGNKNRNMLDVFTSEPEAHRLLATLLEEPTLYDAFLRALARAGYAIPEDILTRDVSQPWVFREDLVPVLREIYVSADTPWGFLRGQRGPGGLGG
jgi:tryptophan 2,3-dioxygenase